MLGVETFLSLILNSLIYSKNERHSLKRDWSFKNFRQMLFIRNV